jgi:hypothetical protein
MRRLSKDEIALIAMVSQFWIDNIAQEDTHKEEYIAVIELRDLAESEIKRA